MKYEETWKALNEVEEDAMALADLDRYCVTEFSSLTKRPAHSMRYAKNTLQHTATHCNTLLRHAARCNAFDEVCEKCVRLLYRSLSMNIGLFNWSLSI